MTIAVHIIRSRQPDVNIWMVLESREATGMHRKESGISSDAKVLDDTMTSITRNTILNEGQIVSKDGDRERKFKRKLRCTMTSKGFNLNVINLRDIDDGIKFDLPWQALAIKMGLSNQWMTNPSRDDLSYYNKYHIDEKSAENLLIRIIACQKILSMFPLKDKVLERSFNSIRYTVSHYNDLIPYSGIRPILLADVAKAMGFNTRDEFISTTRKTHDFFLYENHK